MRTLLIATVILLTRLRLVAAVLVTLVLIAPISSRAQEGEIVPPPSREVTPPGATPAPVGPGPLVREPVVPPAAQAPDTAEPIVGEPTTGWSFDVLTIWHFPVRGWSTIKREPYGVFISKDDCQIARAKKTFELDQGNYRQPHLLPVYARTITDGAKSITAEPPPTVPIETMFVADCRHDVVR
jgi:hypothetical protein